MFLFSDFSLREAHIDIDFVVYPSYICHFTTSGCLNYHRLHVQSLTKGVRVWKTSYVRSRYQPSPTHPHLKQQLQIQGDKVSNMAIIEGVNCDI